MAGARARQCGPVRPVVVAAMVLACLAGPGGVAQASPQDTPTTGQVVGSGEAVPAQPSGTDLSSPDAGREAPWLPDLVEDSQRPGPDQVQVEVLHDLPAAAARRAVEAVGGRVWGSVPGSLVEATVPRSALPSRPQ